MEKCQNHGLPPVACPAIQIDGHIELLLAGDDRRVNQGRASRVRPTYIQVENTYPDIV